MCCKRLSLHHRLVSCASLTAPGNGTASPRVVGSEALLTGREPTPPEITLDMGSEVSASHRLMEAVGQQAQTPGKKKKERKKGKAGGL